MLAIGWEYKALFTATDDGFCIVQVVFDAAGSAIDAVFLEANPSFERNTAVGPVAGMRLSALPGIDTAHWVRLLGEVARTGASARLSSRSRRVERWYDVHAFRIDGPGEHRVAVRFNDITDRRRSEERLGSLYRITTVGVMFWGEGFALVDMNDGFLEMMGYTREEAMGRTWQELTPPEFHPASLKAVEEVTTFGETVPYEKQYIRKDGSRWWGLFAARRIGDEVVEFVLDVTQRKEAEAALREADRRKDEFLATLAHELRNPLAPIRNGLQILHRSTPAASPAQCTLQMLNRQVDHLVRLVDDLLDVARITAGKVRIETRVIPLRDVLARSLEATQAAVGERRHDLQVDLPDGEVYVRGDTDRLAQVFSNLLSNATKYTPAGGRIRLALRVGETDLEVTVSDTGIGIPHDQHARVFELFSQVGDHQRHSEGGLGIGLSLVQSLVDMHGGSVAVESAGPGQGSAFRVTLPRAEAPAAPLSEVPAAGATTAILRILVVDDNEDAAESLAMLLRVDGHEVATASDGAQAVEQVKDFEPDIAFVDLGMPVMDGLEAARRIRRGPAGARVRLVALTGWGQPADRERTRAAGFDLHVVKPVAPGELADALALVDRSRAQSPANA